MEKLSGAFAVLMSPFCGEKLDEPVFRRQAERLAGRGLSGFVVCGSTGEFMRLSEAEQLRELELASEASKGERLVFSACTNDLCDTLRLCRSAKRLGASSALVCPPYYYPMTQSEIEGYYLSLADRSPLPIVLYRVPSFSQEVSESTAVKLAGHGNVLGIKDSSANVKRMAQLADLTKSENFSVLTGTDDILLSCLCAGCEGSMTAYAAIFPERVLEIYRAFAAGELTEAVRAQRGLLSELRTADASTFPLGYKRLLERASGLSFGDRRPDA